MDFFLNKTYSKHRNLVYCSCKNCDSKCAMISPVLQNTPQTKIVSVVPCVNILGRNGGEETKLIH